MTPPRRRWHRLPVPLPVSVERDRRDAGAGGAGLDARASRPFVPIIHETDAAAT